MIRMIRHERCPAVVGTTTARLQLAWPRGDIDATVGLAAGQTAAGIDLWDQYIPSAATSIQSSPKGASDAGCVLSR